MKKPLLPILIPTEPKNRKQRRLYKHEVDRNIQLLDEVEIDFLNDLFTEDEYEEYNDIYKLHHNRFSDLIESMVKSGKFKYTVPNKRFFAEKYKPLETPKTNINIYLTLSELCLK